MEIDQIGSNGINKELEEKKEAISILSNKSLLFN